MTPQDFCYWLQGFLEIAEPEQINGQQLIQIRNHLQLVFNKVTPNIKSFLDEPFCSAPTTSVLKRFDFPATLGISINDPPASC